MTDIDKDINPTLEIPSDFQEEEELGQLKDSADIDKLRSVLNEGEIVYRLVKCFHENSDGILAATNKRIIFADQRFLSSKVVTFKYREVAAVVYSEQIVTQYIALIHSSRSFTVTKVDMEQGKRFIEFIKDAIGQDYSVESNGRVFKHNDDMLHSEDIPSMQLE